MFNESLEEFDLSLDPFYEMMDYIDELCNRLSIMNESSYDELIVVTEGAKEKLVEYIQKVNNSASRAWGNFKADRDRSQIEKTINKDNLKYFATNFRMLCPRNFRIPNMEAWRNIRDTFTVIQINSSSYNNIRQYLETTESFKKQYYPDFFRENELTIQTLNRRVFYQSSGTEVIARNNINQYVNFLLHYNDQMQSIADDIDSINISNQNIQKMIASYPTNEMYNLIFELREVLHEDLNSSSQQTISKYSYRSNTNYNRLQRKSDPTKKFRSADRPNQNPSKLNQDSVKAQSKYIRNYYRVSMNLISCKMKVCARIKNQSLRLCKNYIKLQPKNGINRNRMNSNLSNSQISYVQK